MNKTYCDSCKAEIPSTAQTSTFHVRARNVSLGLDVCTPCMRKIVAEHFHLPWLPKDDQ